MFLLVMQHVLFCAASPIITSVFPLRSGKEFRAADILWPVRAILPPLGAIPSLRWRSKGYQISAIQQILKYMQYISTVTVKALE